VAIALIMPAEVGKRDFLFAASISGNTVCFACNPHVNWHEDFLFLRQGGEVIGYL
jgi:hypothetical protein